MTTLQNIYKKDNSTTNHREQQLYNKSPRTNTFSQITKNNNSITNYQNDHFFTNHQEQQLYNKSPRTTTFSQITKNNNSITNYQNDHFFTNHNNSTTNHKV